MNIRWGKIKQSRVTIAAMASGVMLALGLVTAGIGLAPAASASTAARQTHQSASQTAGTITPAETIGPINGGSYPTLSDCNSALNELKTNPEYAGGYCLLKNGKWVAYYYILVSACITPSVTASRPVSEPAAC
jgi:hypothetical protein